MTPEPEPSSEALALRASLLRPRLRTHVRLSGAGVIIDERTVVLGVLDTGTREHLVPFEDIGEVRVRLAESVPQLLVGLALIAAVVPLAAASTLAAALAGALGAALALTSPVARLRLGRRAGVTLGEVPATELGRLRRVGARIAGRSGLDPGDGGEPT